MRHEDADDREIGGLSNEIVSGIDYSARRVT
jgi:hypothetical protein